MAKRKFYQYDKCSTCKKAQKYLDSKGIDYEKIDITEKPPTNKDLQTMLKAYEGEFKRLFNTSGVMYRELSIKEQMPTMTGAKAIKVLSGKGKLIKRPFLLSGAKGVIGFKQDEWDELLG